jgi:hypothetical protein
MRLRQQEGIILTTQVKILLSQLTKVSILLGQCMFKLFLKLKVKAISGIYMMSLRSGVIKIIL